MTQLRTASWNNIGTDVKACNNNMNDILLKAGLDYEVISQPVYTADQQLLEGFQALTRNTDNHLYNVVKSNYTPIQNKDAFSALSTVSDDLEVIKAGETKSGIVYLIAKSDEFNILGDDFENYIIFQNSHNYASSLKAAITPLRCICQNQFSTAFQGATNSVSFRHTPSALTNVANMGNILKSQHEHQLALSEFAEEAAKKKMSLGSFMLQMFPETSEMSELQVKRLYETRQMFSDMYNMEDNANFVNTGWGIINAAADYLTHATTKRKNAEETRFIRTLDSNNVLKKAIQIVKEAA